MKNFKIVDEKLGYVYVIFNRYVVVFLVNVTPAVVTFPQLFLP